MTLASTNGPLLTPELEGLKNFRGVKRRFTQVKKINSTKIFDDYAHHPKEISVTLLALKQITKGKVIAIYEPHRYSRLENLFDDFTNCFNNANFLLIKIGIAS